MDMVYLDDAEFKRLVDERKAKHPEMAVAPMAPAARNRQ